MAFRNISVLLTANSTSLRSQLNQAATQVDRFANKVEAHHKGVISSSKLMQAAVVGGAAAVAAGLAYAVVGAAQFEQRMRNVNSISQLGEAQFKALGRSVLNLSKTVPQSANDLAEGLYDIASSGFQGAEGLQVLNAAAVAASAGMSTTANSAKAITAVLNAYGRGAGDANDVSDALFQTVNLGVISFDELTGVIGDVVGTAAAASVDINQVGSAIATMTLSGLSGAEAGTSLNRVLQSLLQPSKSLTVLYKQMGYESGAAALKQKGLHGVIEDIRVATGGSIESLLALFPEIRSARGALALMSAQGKNYNKVAAEIEDKNKRAGSTMRAFKEQSKAVAFQFEIFKNKVNAGAITLGSKLLPVMLDAMKLIGRFGNATGDVLKRLTPFFRSLASIGVDLWTVIRRIADAATPMVKVLAGLVALPLIATLNEASKLLAELIHFVTNNDVAFAALAATISVALVPAIYRMVAGLAYSIFEGAVIGLSNLLFAAESAAGGFTMLAVAEGAASAGLTAIVAAGILAFESLRKTSRDSKREISSLYAEMRKQDGNSPALMSNSLMDLQKRLEDQKKRARELGTTKIKTGFTTTTLPFKFDLHFGGDDYTRATAKVSQLQKSIKDLTRDQRHVGDNLKDIAKQTGLSWTEIVQIADRGKIDLTKGYNESNDARQQVIDKIHEMEVASRTSGTVLAKVAGDDVAAMEALAKVIDDVSKKASDAFDASTDVISGFKFDDGAKAAKATTAATEKLSKAQQKLSDMETRQAAKKRLTVADDQALARARKDVADATAAVTKAEGTKPDSKAAQLRAFYTQTLKESTEFVNNINAATQKGLDPRLIQRLLEAGPKAANPILEAMLSDHSGRMIQIANESEAKLREINTRVVEFARLTTLAVSSSTDTMAKDLGTAMKVASTNMAQGAKATVESIAKAIGVPTDEVLRIAAEYGITIAGAIQAGLDSVPLVSPVLRPASAEAQANAEKQGMYILPGGKRVPLARGGYVSGPGTGTSDSIPAQLSNGEYVVRAAAVRAIGLGTMHRINAYAQGGLVQASSRPVSGLAPRGGDSYTTIHKYEFNGPIVGVRMEDAERYAARRRQQNALAGAGA